MSERISDEEVERLCMAGRAALLSIGAVMMIWPDDGIKTKADWRRVARQIADDGTATNAVGFSSRHFAAFAAAVRAEIAKAKRVPTREELERCADAGCVAIGHPERAPHYDGTIADTADIILARETARWSEDARRAIRAEWARICNEPAPYAGTPSGYAVTSSGGAGGGHQTIAPPVTADPRLRAACDRARGLLGLPAIERLDRDTCRAAATFRHRLRVPSVALAAEAARFIGGLQLRDADRAEQRAAVLALGAVTGARVNG